MRLIFTIKFSMKLGPRAWLSINLNYFEKLLRYSDCPRILQQGCSEKEIHTVSEVCL
jgi:hypothetical protein